MIHTHIGFTGSRRGMSPPQKQTFILVLSSLLSPDRHLDPQWLHHGDCVGADEIAHRAAKAYKLMIHVHPPLSSKLRAHCQGDVVSDPKPYLIRNHDIVDISTILIATPSAKNWNTTTMRAGGTWHTYRYARRLSHARVVIWPDGSKDVYKITFGANSDDSDED